MRFNPFLLSFLLFWSVFSVSCQEDLSTFHFSSVSVQFEFPSKKVKGSFKEFQLPMAVSLHSFQEESWKATIEVGSIKTGNGIRDWHLMSAKYFNRKEHPRMTFIGTGWEEMRSDYKLTGDLTIKGVTRPVTLRIIPEYTPRNRYVAVGSLNSSDFGIWIKKKKEENVVKIQMRFDLIEN